MSYTEKRKLIHSGDASMDIRKFKKGLLAVLLCAMLGCVLLCGCSGMDSCVSGCSLLRSVWEPELLLSGDEDTPLPVIEGTLSSQEVTAQLREYYEPVIDFVNFANTNGDMFSLEYRLTAVEESHYLHADIVCSPSGRLPLPRVYIPYAGETVLPVWSAPSQLSCAEDAAAWLELTANGVELDLNRFDERLTMQGMMEILLDYYDSLTALEPDLSRFAESVDYSDDLKKAMVTGLCDGEYQWTDDEVTPANALDAVCGLLGALNMDACGCGSKGILRTDLLQTLRTLLASGLIADSEWMSDVRLMVRIIDEDMLPEAKIAASELARMEIAPVFVELAELMYGTIGSWEEYRDIVTDSVDPNILKAVKAGYMSCRLNYGQFAPAYAPGMAELPGLVHDFIFQCTLDADVDMWEQGVTYGQLLRGISAVDVCVRRQGLCAKAPLRVVNSPDYDWYYTQHGTGWYSGVNCMPTITMMATKWYDRSTTVTIEEMRNRYLPEYNGGWYTWQVAECLTENGVPNRLVDVGEDMLPYLDEGKIILTQMSEAADSESGHCFVIYGYIRLGDSISYLVHDPDVYDGIDSYGQRPGRAMVLDSRYCEWIIDRIAFSYVVVGD